MIVILIVLVIVEIYLLSLGMRSLLSHRRLCKQLRTINEYEIGKQLRAEFPQYAHLHMKPSAKIYPFRRTKDE